MPFVWGLINSGKFDWLCKFKKTTPSPEHLGAANWAPRLRPRLRPCRRLRVMFLYHGGQNGQLPGEPQTGTWDPGTGSWDPGAGPADPGIDPGVPRSGPGVSGIGPGDPQARIQVADSRGRRRATHARTISPGPLPWGAVWVSQLPTRLGDWLILTVSQENPSRPPLKHLLKVIISYCFGALWV